MEVKSSIDQVESGELESRELASGAPPVVPLAAHRQSPHAIPGLTHDVAQFAGLMVAVVTGNRAMGSLGFHDFSVGCDQYGAITDTTR